MKKLLLLSTVAVAGIAFAGDVETSNSYGVLPIETSQKATMVAVPFVGDGANISIDQMVKAANLSVGDKIFALPSGNNVYQVWELTNSGETLSWTPCVGASVGEGVQFTAPAAAGTTLPRGQAFWLVRGSASTTTFYVMGVGTTETAADTPVSQGWNLVGQSSATGTKKLADIASAVGDKGSVRLNNGTRYLYSGGNWYQVSGNTPTPVTAEVALPVGEGFWIVRQASGNASASL